MSGHYSHLTSYGQTLLIILVATVLLYKIPEWLGWAWDRYISKGRQKIGDKPLEKEDIDKIIGLANYDSEREKSKKHDGKSSFYQKYW